MRRLNLLMVLGRQGLQSQLRNNGFTPGSAGLYCETIIQFI